MPFVAREPILLIFHKLYRCRKSPLKMGIGKLTGIAVICADSGSEAFYLAEDEAS
jgi:hypothetical protein